MVDKITHELARDASDYAVNIDLEVTMRDCGSVYALDRSIVLSLGAFRAFEFLEKNGYRLVKVQPENDTVGDYGSFL